jgi:hypothetical protein
MDINPVYFMIGIVVVSLIILVIGSIPGWVVGKDHSKYKNIHKLGMWGIVFWPLWLGALVWAIVVKK